MLGLLKTRSLQTSVLAALLFYVFANPGMYKIIRKIPGLKFVMKGATEITHQGTLVNALLFALIFLLCVYLINSHLIKDHLKFINIVEYMTEHGPFGTPKAKTVGIQDREAHGLSRNSVLTDRLAAGGTGRLAWEKAVVAGGDGMPHSSLGDVELRPLPPRAAKYTSYLPPTQAQKPLPATHPTEIPKSTPLHGGAQPEGEGGGSGGMGGAAAPEPEPSMAPPHHTTKGWKMPIHQVKLSSHHGHTQLHAPEGSGGHTVHTQEEGSVEEAMREL